MDTVATPSVHTSDPRPHAAVIGAGLGGLAAAMRLGAKGWRVTVLDRLDTPGGRGGALHCDDFRFDLGPTIVTCPQVFEELFAVCGIEFQDEVDLRALDPFYRIIWPDGSDFTARASTEAMVEEIRRLSPKDVNGYLRFLKDAERRYIVGYEGLVAKPMHRFSDTARVIPEFARLRADRSILGLVRRRVQDERLRMALSFHPLFIGGDPRHVTSMYALVSHLEKAFGVHYAIGGVAAIAEAMLRVVEGQGAQVRFGAEVARIDGDSHAEGVTLSSGERLPSDIVVSGADAGHTYTELLPDRVKRRWSNRRLDRTKWSMGLFVWYFGTSGTRDLWPEAGHHTILSGPRYEGLLHDIFTRKVLADDMSLYVHRPSVTDPTVAPLGGDAFYTLSPVPNLGGESPVNWKEEAPRYRQKVLKTLEQRLLPGLRDHIITEEIFTPETFRDRYLSPHGCGFSIEPRILQSAWFRPHNVSEELPGLYLVGAGTHPGAGLPGVVSSAKVLAQVVPDTPSLETEVRMAAE